MGAAVDIKSRMSKKINESLCDGIRNNTCCGSSDRELKHLVQDYLNARCSCDADFALIADAAHLMPQTVLRVANQDANGEEDYQPFADTLQRLLRVMDIRLEGTHQRVNKKYLPTAKNPELERSAYD